MKTKQNEVKLSKISQDRSKTNVFVSTCVEEEKRKIEASFFWGKKTKKNEYNRSSTIEDLPLLHWCWSFLLLWALRTFQGSSWCLLRAALFGLPSRGGFFRSGCHCHFQSGSL
jgi:hypothetical protein